MSANMLIASSRSLAVCMLALFLSIMFILVPYPSCQGQTGADSDQQTSHASNQVKVPHEQPGHSMVKQPETKANAEETSIGKVDEEAADTSTPTKENTSDETKPDENLVPLRQNEQFARQFDQLVEAIQTGKKTDADADILYRQVSSALRTKRNELRNMLQSRQQSTSVSGSDTKK